ncbi:a-pheromone receptor PreA [Histoplasma capsulatum var. duboisii H88]|uniref:A-pheromone receptor PreA n=1 Tax=Ajellomyces capsulatus (strain H88) TaxID=544711 RepID=A0A8A1LUB5_AJEC8|nr:a-pheromone receptor PreA [Histoplasma capsulatum var. duboisii H88]
MPRGSIGLLTLYFACTFVAVSLLLLAQTPNRKYVFISANPPLFPIYACRDTSTAHDSLPSFFE